jgi:hypothetical protein
MHSIDWDWPGKAVMLRVRFLFPHRPGSVE